eukprot:g7616.t1
MELSIHNKNSATTIITEEQKTAATIASRLANNVDIDLILKGFERALVFFTFEELCLIEIVSVSFRQLIYQNGFHVWKALVHANRYEKKYCHTIPFMDASTTDKNVVVETKKKTPSYWKLCLIRSRQNEVDDELSHLSHTALLKQLLNDVSNIYVNDKNIKIYGVVCDIVTTNNIVFAKVISRVRVSAMNTILVLNIKTLSTIKQYCAETKKYRCLIGQLAFITWSADDERKRLKVEKIMGYSPKVIMKENEVPGFIGHADELLYVKPEHWFLKGAIKQIFSFILVFVDDQSAITYIKGKQNSLNKRHAGHNGDDNRIHYITLDLFDEIYHPSFSQDISPWFADQLENNVVPSYMYNEDFTTYYCRKGDSKAYRGPSFRRYHSELDRRFNGFVIAHQNKNDDIITYENKVFQKSGPRIHPFTFRHVDDYMKQGDPPKFKLLKKKWRLNDAFMKIYRNNYTSYKV